MYKDQGHKNNALRSLLDYLVNHSKRPGDSGHVDFERDLGRAAAYGDAATRLNAILSTPIESAPDPVQPYPESVGIPLYFHSHDVTVIVVAPEGVMGKDMPQFLFLGPNDLLEMDTLNPFTRLVVGALLDQAREKLD